MAQPERADLIRAMLQRVIVHESSIELRLRLDPLVQTLLGKPVGDLTQNIHDQTISLKASFRLVPQGRTLSLVIGNDRT
jgi:hypothetical protein